MVSFAGFLLPFCLCVMTFRSRAEVSPYETSSASSSINPRYTNSTISSSATQGTNFANASATNTSIEHNPEDFAVTNTYNIWVTNSTNVKGNNIMLKTLQGFGLSLDQIMCSQFGSGLTDVNFFTTVLTDAQARNIGNLKEASNAILNFLSVQPLTQI